jgi:hypothetical protein
MLRRAASNIKHVAEGEPAAGSGQDDADDLLLLAVSRPREALAYARRTRMKHRLLIKPSVSCFATSVTSMLGYMSCGLHCAWLVELTRQTVKPTCWGLWA